ncbi:9008_t:CDS:2, partial [Racocetra fulgida]
NKDIITPTDQELRELQVEGLLKHLQDNHSLCLNEVCWYKDNPELELALPNLKKSTIRKIDEFCNFLKSIFRLSATIIYNNDGLTQMLIQVCDFCRAKSFSEQDLKNIEKMAKDRNSQKLCKREQIESRNKKRTIEYKTKRDDL